MFSYAGSLVGDVILALFPITFAQSSDRDGDMISHTHLTESWGAVEDAEQYRIEHSCDQSTGRQCVSLYTKIRGALGGLTCRRLDAR